MARRGRGAAITARIAITDESWKKFRAQLKNLEKAVRREIMEQAVMAGAEIVKAQANVLAPGPHIEAVIDNVSDSNATAHVGPDDEHWRYRFVELGATPHEIQGTPLVFEGDGGTVVTGSVSHPGMIAEPFLRPAAEEKSREAQQAMADVIDDEMRKAA